MDAFSIRHMMQFLPWNHHVSTISSTQRHCWANMAASWRRAAEMWWRSRNLGIEGFQKRKRSQMGVSKNSGTPKSSILIGFSIINHPFWSTPIVGNTYINHLSCSCHFFLSKGLVPLKKKNWNLVIRSFQNWTLRAPRRFASESQ